MIFHAFRRASPKRLCSSFSVSIEFGREEQDKEKSWQSFVVRGSWFVRLSKASQRQQTGPKGTEPAAIWRNTSPHVKSRVGQREASPLMEERVA